MKSVTFLKKTCKSSRIQIKKKDEEREAEGRGEEWGRRGGGGGGEEEGKWEVEEEGGD